MRISSALLLAVCAAACSPEQTANTQVLANVEATQDQEAADNGLINCAVGAAATLSRVCSVERQESDRGLLLTVRHPDGGFRRLLVTKDGHGVVAADGAEPAQVTLVGTNEIEVRLGDDVYRLPVTVKPTDLKRQ
ncbi:hypothetical protein [Sphingomonas sp. Mn802worker]|uniref:hypothetical protein n=1 Tax=Sphingomonas sp. Mn802worker TaxID=629773 RepID=UPI000374AEA4|nr:hypothetical protein [Sphingomonas sp. Mn802worker]